MSDRRLSVRSPNQLKEELSALVDAGFLCGWRRSGAYWEIDAMGARTGYTQAQISAWLDGAHAMGAW